MASVAPESQGKRKAKRADMNTSVILNRYNCSQGDLRLHCSGTGMQEACFLWLGKLIQSFFLQHFDGVVYTLIDDDNSSSINSSSSSRSDDDNDDGDDDGSGGGSGDDSDNDNNNNSDYKDDDGHH